MCLMKQMGCNGNCSGDVTQALFSVCSERVMAHEKMSLLGERKPNSLSGVFERRGMRLSA